LPKKLLLRYSSKISSLASSRSIFIASSISANLRRKLYSELRKNCLATCWVMVGAAGHPLPAAGLRQQPDRAQHALHVDAVVLVEVGVFGGQEGLLDPRRNLADLDRIAPHLAEQADQAPIARIDVHRLLQLDRAQALHVRQARAHRVDHDAQRHAARETDGGGAEEEPAQQAGEAGHGRRFRLQQTGLRSIE